MPEFVALVPVRWSDQDLNRHVNHAKAVTLLEEARLTWRHHLVSASGLDLFHGPSVIASLSIDYRRAIVYGPPLEIGIAVGRVGSSSYTLSYVGCQDGMTALEASTVIVGLDSGTGRARQLTADERAVLASAVPDRAERVRAIAAGSMN